ncbi:MAG: hypothetical protein L0H73_14980 [Nitrococcus sp.]|nr:hypothetical protein [Nitrococcus sp.]
MRYMGLILLLTILALTVSDAALAYVGPGAGLSLLGALWGLLLAVGAALGFVIFWPLRQWRKRARAKRGEAENDPAMQRAPGQDSEEIEELRRRAR